MTYETKVVNRDIGGGVYVRVQKFRCPKCGQWADIDDDQFHGRVSIFHDEPGCGFHETINLADAP